MSQMFSSNININPSLNNNNSNTNISYLNKTSHSRLKKNSSIESRRKSSMYRMKKQTSNSKSEYNVEIGVSNPKIKENVKYGNNAITTTRYNVITFIPKNILFQFTRVSNIYFLIVSILTFMPFSPKEPASMIGTFIFVLFCTLCKDGIEDLGRYKQDRISNNRIALKYNNNAWQKDKCCLLRPGDIVKIEKEEEFSSDVLIIRSSNNGGYLYLDTKNLDGETNLKEKCTLEEFKDISMEMIDFEEAVGTLETTVSDANLNEWEGVLSYFGYSDVYCCSKNLILKGSMLKNTSYVYGIVVYVGHQTKIMKNAKHPNPKTSKMMKTMNLILYTLFGFTLVICIIFGVLSVIYTDENSQKYTYIYYKYDPDDKNNHWGIRFLLNFLTFFIVYAQIIPISLYVIIELIKLFQGELIKYDNDIYDLDLRKPAICRATDLIEELGQIDFLFCDKTGTLTKNEMIFKRCFVNGKVYGAEKDSNTFANNFNSINGDFDAYHKLIKSPIEDKENYTENDKKDQKMLNLFFLSLSLCHDVFPDIKNNTIIYEGSSPDDIALVKGAQQFGYEFISKDFNVLTIKNDIKNISTEYEILSFIPFSSERKRMSVIVKERSTKKVYMFGKGSDGVMLKKRNVKNNPIISKYNYVTEANDVLKVLDCFSKEGLRILVMGYKEISKEKIEKWIIKHDQARLKDPGLLVKLYDDIEKDMTFLGCSAIEDKLQDGVPDTVKILMSCGIRLWVLTGDKQTTAEQIGRQCRLITDNMDLINLTVENESSESLRSVLLQLMNKYNLSQFLFEKKFDLEKNIRKLYENSTILYSISLIIDGVCFDHVYNDKELSKMFFLIGAISKSVTCCRVSPKQKSHIVRLVKTYGDFVTLAIGDGANDVPMILESSIGVGIQGKEGTQAVRSADYSIGQFRFLEKLILFYGRNGYIKISKYICYYFYKNILLVITELCFAFYDGFSGQIFFADWLGTMFNAIFTSWPCLFGFAYEREHSVSICKKYPILYKAGPKNTLFNLKVFWTYIFYGILHSILCFYIPSTSMTGVLNDKGLTMNHWRISSVSFSCVIHVVSLKLLIISEFWNQLSICFTIVSIIFYYSIILALSTEFFGKIFQNELIGVAFDILSDFKTVLIILIAPFYICLPDIIIKQVYYTFFPSPSEYIFKYRNKIEFKDSLLRKNCSQLHSQSMSFPFAINENQKKKENTMMISDSIIDDSNSPLKCVRSLNQQSLLQTNNRPPTTSLTVHKSPKNKLTEDKQKELALYPDVFTRNQLETDIQYDNLNKADFVKNNRILIDHKSVNDVVTSNEIEKNKSNSSYDIPDLYPIGYLVNKKVHLKNLKRNSCE